MLSTIRIFLEHELCLLPRCTILQHKFSRGSSSLIASTINYLNHGTQQYLLKLIIVHDIRKTQIS